MAEAAALYAVQRYGLHEDVHEDVEKSGRIEVRLLVPALQLNRSERRAPFDDEET